MILLIPVDMKQNPKVLKSMKDGDVHILAVVDPELVRLSAEMAIEKGWLGDKATSDIYRFLLKQLRRMRKEFVEQAVKLLQIKEIKITYDEKDGNFVEEIKKAVSSKNVHTVIFCHKNGYNPYWSVLKPIVNKLCKELNVKNCKVIN